MASFLKGDITIPHVGKFPKVAVYGGVGVVGVLIVVEYRKRASAAAAAPAGTDVTAGAATGDEDPFSWDGTYNESGDPYSMDTGSGETYGDEGDSGGGSSTGTYSGGGPPFTTNSSWAQYVLGYFTEVDGMSDAIGAYLNGQPVTDAQHALINDAIAVGGPVPVAGPGGFPPSIKLSGATGGGGGATKSTPPTAKPALSVATSSNQLTVSWKSVTTATKYEVLVMGPSAGTKADSTVTQTKAVYSVATSGDTGEVKVRAGNAAGWGPWSATGKFKFTATRSIVKK